jgi:lycopene cyclase domain-containing protein
MRYLLLNLIVLLVIAVVFRSKLRQGISRASLYTLLVILLLTALFDSLIIMAGVVSYNLPNILGIYIFKAPVEDFFYTVVSVLLVVVLWEHYEKDK